MQKLTLLLCLMFGTFTTFAQQTNIYKHAHLQEVAMKHKLTPSDILDYTISDNYVSSTSGIRNVYLNQQFQGVPIYQAIIGIHIAPDGNLFHSTSRFLPKLHLRVNTSAASISPEEALQAAALHLDLGAPENLRTLKDGLFNAAGISADDIPFKPIYQLTSDGNINLCWNFVIRETKSANWWDLRVDANTGAVLDKTNWTISCNWDAPEGQEHKHVHSTACGSNRKQSEVNNNKNSTSLNPDSYNVYPLGVESPNHGLREIVVDPADLVASPFAWHDTNGNAGAEFTNTRGNNVYAYEDRNNTDSPGNSPDGGGNLDFDFPLDPTQTPVNSEDAVITNLFYWNNVMHDVWYQYGFDEASGNFQENNYGRGGAGSDYVNAEAQDGSGTNNANFSAPADGSNPRMQMFLWNGAASANFIVNSPGNIADPYFAVVGSFGPSAFNITGELVLADDGSAAPTEACNALVNVGAINGNIAVIDRGNCEFGLKALQAQNAGAIAVVICNNVATDPFEMAPGANGASVNIPAIMISQADCATIRVEIPTVNVTMQASGAVPYDSDLDNGIIAHEYGHGISIRLAGGPGTSGCLSNTEQMGEGWSDWFGLMMTIDPSDVGTERRGVGTYVQGQPTTGNGIRTYPYSTDMGINPHTYTDISGESVPHGVGSVWCAMLWEMSWLLIEQEGYDPDLYNGTGGNNIAMALVIEGLKLQSCSPGFQDGRDAILAADQALYGGANRCLIWEAFAKRGMGFSASQGSSGSASDGTQSFDMPPDCSLSVMKTVDKLSATVGDTLTYTITVTNTFGGTLNNIVVTDDLPGNTIYLAGSADNGGGLSGNSVVYPAVSMTAGEVLVYTFSVTVDPATDVTPYTTFEDAETVTGDWVATSTAPATGGWTISNTNPYAGNGVWFAVDYDTPDEQYLTISEVIMPSGTSTMRFWHSYDTEETWDGGLIQVSTDNQTTWQGLGGFITQNGYNSTIDQNANTPAFSGTSNGYIESIVDLSSFDGQSISIRFWMHCDPAVGGVGWYVDNIQIADLIVVVPNTVVVTSDGLDDVYASLPDVTQLSLCPTCTHCDDGIQNADELAVDCGGVLCEPCIEGCTDTLAHNYDATAQVDNGSCETCSDGILNGDEVSVDCGGALCVPCVEGCTDSLAHNYDAAANVDNGSCETCSDGFLNGDEVAVDCGGVLCVPCLEGCMDTLAHNYDPLAQVDNGSCETCTDGVLNGDEVAIDCDGILCVPCIEGCTDTLAHNYDATAQVDNGSCETCSDGILNGDEVAIDCGGILCVPCIEGCTDTLAHNYDATAHVDNGTCETCNDGILNGDEVAVDCGGILCVPCLEGCMDTLAHNYDPLAQVDNGSCETCSDGVLNGDEVAIDCGGILCVPCIEGCTDTLAHNYNATAQVDNGTCETCTDGILNGDEVAIDCGGILCVPCIEGCTDTLAHNYDATAQVDNGTCETCSDGVLNGDEVAVDCGGILCVPCLEGCMDVLAHNYDPAAQVDDGTCETCKDDILNGDETFVDCGGSLCIPCVEGCTDSLAHNYNPDAQIEDGTCETCDDGIQNGDETGIDCGGALCGNCPPPCSDILIFTQDFNSNILEYRANIQIQSTSLIMGGSDVNLIAGDNIELNSGFEIEEGSQLLATIGTCYGNTLRMDSGNGVMENSVTAKVAINYSNISRDLTFDVQRTEGEPTEVRLYNLTGELVSTYQADPVGEHFVMSAGHLPAGLYLFEIKVGQQQFYTRMFMD